MSTSGKELVEELMNDQLAFAIRMLEECGAFHPFGGRAFNGKIEQIGVEGGNDQDKLKTIETYLRDSIAAGDTQAVARTSNVDIQLHGSKVSAIKFELEHVDGYRADVFMLYILDSEGRISINETFAQRRSAVFSA
jgi:hypothetical protein